MPRVWRSTPSSESTALAETSVGLPEQQLRERHRVDAEVEQRAAALRGVPQPVRGREGPGETEVGLHRADLADRAVLDQRRSAAGSAGCSTSTWPPSGSAPRSRASATSSSRLPRVQRERLLAQHVPPGLQAQPGGGPVRRVRGGDVHDVDVRRPRPAPPSRRTPAGSRTVPRTPSPRPRCREATATTSASGRSTRSAVNAAAIPPVARIPHRTRSARQCLPLVP